MADPIESRTNKALETEGGQMSRAAESDVASGKVADFDPATRAAITEGDEGAPVGDASWDRAEAIREARIASDPTDPIFVNTGLESEGLTDEQIAAAAGRAGSLAVAPDEGPMSHLQRIEQDLDTASADTTADEPPQATITE